MPTYLTVSGAYGRDYRSAKAAQADWAKGLDFTVRSLFHRGGTYISKPEADREGNLHVMIRYKDDTMICGAESKSGQKKRRLPNPMPEPKAREQ